MKILLAPYAAALPTGKPNPKNFPHWAEVVGRLNTLGHEVVQIAKGGEPRIEGVAQYVVNWPLEKLNDLVNQCDTWLSVDSFLPHLCATNRLKPGIVVWSQSDHRIWGYAHNTNLLKSRDYLRQFQYAPWYEAEYEADAFVTADEVVEAVCDRLFTKVA